MDNQELLQAISALLEKELGAMRDEMNYKFETVTNRLDKLEAGQKQIREDIADLRNGIVEELPNVVEAIGKELDPLYDKVNEHDKAIAWLAHSHTPTLLTKR